MNWEAWAECYKASSSVLFRWSVLWLAFHFLWDGVWSSILENAFIGFHLKKIDHDNKTIQLLSVNRLEPSTLKGILVRIRRNVNIQSTWGYGVVTMLCECVGGGHELKNTSYEGAVLGRDVLLKVWTIFSEHCYVVMGIKVHNVHFHRYILICKDLQQSSAEYLYYVLVTIEKKTG